MNTLTQENRKSTTNPQRVEMLYNLSTTSPQQIHNKSTTNRIRIVVPSITSSQGGRPQPPIFFKNVSAQYLQACGLNYLRLYCRNLNFIKYSGYIRKPLLKVDTASHTVTTIGPSRRLNTQAYCTLRRDGFTPLARRKSPLSCHGLADERSHVGQLSLLPSAGREITKYQTKCGDALRLESKGRYGLFHL